MYVVRQLLSGMQIPVSYLYMVSYSVAYLINHTCILQGKAPFQVFQSDLEAFCVYKIDGVGLTRMSLK